MNGIAAKATALQPPADLQSVQGNLMKSVTDWQNGLQAAQAAAGTQNWTDAANAAAQMTQGMTDLTGLLSYLTSHGIK
jgi:hypothetical protein